MLIPMDIKINIMKNNNNKALSITAATQSYSISAIVLCNGVPIIETCISSKKFSNILSQRKWKRMVVDLSKRDCRSKQWGLIWDFLSDLHGLVLVTWFYLPSLKSGLLSPIFWFTWFLSLLQLFSDRNLLATAPFSSGLMGSEIVMSLEVRSSSR